MHYFRPRFWLVACTVLSQALLLTSTVHAQVIVIPTVTSSGGAYHYNYSVTDNSPLDLSVVTINVFSLPTAVQNLTAPAGFNVNFDPGLGLVDFLEDTQTFAAGTTVTGFKFDSAFGANPSGFQALALNGNGGLVTFQGTTLAPSAPAATPEPGTLGLGVALVSGLLLLGSRRLKTTARRLRDEGAQRRFRRCIR